MKNLAKIFLLIFIFSVIFISVYGYHILNPFYTAWYTDFRIYKSDQDMLYAYSQLVAFLNSGSLLYADNVSFPFEINIIFINIIPLFAIPVKFFLLYILNLPQSDFIDIQYFGIWGLLCFILQGIFAFLIIRKFTNYKNAVLCSMFFLFAPTLFYRFPYNQSLAAHWLILAALVPIFYYNNLSKAKFYSIYFILGILCSCIHPYFIPIVSIVVMGSCFYLFLKARNFKCMIPLVAYVFGVFLLLSLLVGTNIFEMDSSVEGYSYFNANLLTFFAPELHVFRSSIFSFLNHEVTVINGQNEGYAYLGGGIIILLILLFILSLIKFKSLKQMLIDYKCEFLSLLFIFLFSYIFAILPVISFSDYVIYSFHFSPKVEEFLNIFRTPGRFIWPSFYVVYIVSFILLLKILADKKKLLTIIISILLCLQVYDLFPIISYLHYHYANKIQHEKMKNEKLWKQILDGKKHVISNVINNGIPYSLMLLCLENGKKTNFVQDNRLPDDFGANLEYDYQNPSDENVYVFVFDDIEKQKQFLKEDTKIKHFYLIDEKTIVGTKNKIKNLDEYELLI